MTEEERRNHHYAGDGVYVEFDGYGLKLRANHHTERGCTDRIYIEPDVLESLNEFYKSKVKEKK